MDVNPQNTEGMAWELNENGLTIIPLGSPFETPPRWFLNDRCDGDKAKAAIEWPKTPRIKWKDYQEAPASDLVIGSWVQKWPCTNWAIVTGQKIIVVDADSDEAVAFMESGKVTRTPVRVKTRQGKHFYFANNPNLQIRNSANKNKIDIRGKGGYVVAPGSAHPSGIVYEWEVDDGYPLSDLMDLPVLNAEDLAAINGFNGQSTDNPPAGNLGFSADQYAVPHDGGHLAEGEGRNNAAASMTGQLIRQGYSLLEIKGILDQWNQGNYPPLLETELNTTIASVTRTHLSNNPGSQILVEPLPPGQAGIKFSFSHVRDLISEPKPINWLIKGFLEMDSLSLMFGEPGCGKSFVAIDAACCIATGANWHGKEVKQSGPVFYIAGEGFNGIARRLMAWQQVNGYNLRKSDLYVSQCPAALTDLGSAREVSSAIHTIIEETGGQAPALIVIDTLARNFGAGDENATKEMNLFISHIDEYLRKQYGCCVLIVHHSGVGKSDRARGSSALKGALDAEYAVVKSDDELRISPKKMKDADEPEPMHFMFESVQLPFTDEDGEPQISCVLQYLDPEIARKMANQKRVGGTQKKVLMALDVLFNDARYNLTQQGRAPENAHIEVKGLRDECVKSERAFLGKTNWPKTLNALVEKELVSINGVHIDLTDSGRQALLDD